MLLYIPHYVVGPKDRQRRYAALMFFGYCVATPIGVILR